MCIHIRVPFNGRATAVCSATVVLLLSRCRRCRLRRLSPPANVLHSATIVLSSVAALPPLTSVAVRRRLLTSACWTTCCRLSPCAVAAIAVAVDGSVAVFSSS